MNDITNTMILDTDSLNFVGAGKLMYNNFSASFNIPHLHFLVIKHNEKRYEAVNLELQLFATENTPEDAIAELATLTSMHIITVFNQGRGYEELIEIAIQRTMDDYWAEYRKIEFKAAKNKEDIGHDVEQRVNNIIMNMVGEKTKELLKEFVKEHAQFVDEKIEEIFDFVIRSIPDILYQEAA